MNVHDSIEYTEINKGIVHLSASVCKLIKVLIGSADELQPELFHYFSFDTCNASSQIHNYHKGDNDV